MFTLIYFDKANVREKAIAVGEKQLFGLYYDYDSAFEHSLWGAIICVQDYTNRIKETRFEKSLFRAIEEEKVFTEKQHPKLLINIIDKTIKDSLQKQN